MSGTATVPDPNHQAAPDATPPATPPDAVGALAERWGRHPDVLRAAAPVTADQAHALAVTCSDPFRSGTQAHAVTRVRFHTTAGRLVSPGDLLPRGGDDGDRGVAGYLARISARLPGQGWMYSVEQPLHRDADVWLRVRDQLAALWDHVGQPALPVTSSVAVGTGYHRPPALSASPGDAVLVWVLHGECAVRLRRTDAVGPGDRGEAEPDAPREPAGGPPDVVLHGTAGDLLHWPAGYHSTEQFPGDGAVLRVTVPADPPRVHRLLVEELLEAAGRHVPETPPLPLLPHHGGQPAGDATTPTPALAPLHDVAGGLADLLASPEFDAGLRTRWALRRSTAGVEPAPDPAPDPADGPPAGPAAGQSTPGPAAESRLDGDSTLRVTTPIVSVDHGERTVWAVNGHPLPLAGDSARAVRAQLTEGRELTVADLCREIGAPPGHPQVVDLLRTLQRLRAVRVRPAARTMPTPATSPSDAHEDSRS